MNSIKRLLCILLILSVVFSLSMAIPAFAEPMDMSPGGKNAAPKPNPSGTAVTTASPSPAAAQASATPAPVNASPAPANTVNNQAVADGFRAVWVGTIKNLDYPSKAGLSTDVLKQEAIEILDNARDMGMNAVVLQVRPSGDAFYPSKIYPWSEYLTGAQGVAPANNFDPLKFWVDEAHKRGLQLHAWVNPLRVSRGSEAAPSHDISRLANMNPAKLNPSWVVKHPDGNMYLDPGIPAVRQLVVSGIAEIVRDYAVDGIHLDDYFYPGKDFADDASFKTYGKNFANRDDWRRDNTNTIIKDISATVKSIKPTVVFGVSPFAIWANKTSSPFGSDTSGNESYYYMYADTYKWVKSEWVDYICPQVYWAIGYKIADYSVVVRWWADVVRNTKVKLYIGHAAYRSNSSSNPSDAWYGTGELKRQIEFNRGIPEVSGSFFFRYGTIADDTSVTNLLRSIYNPAYVPPSPDVGNVPGGGSLKVGRPAGNATTNYASYYIIGASDPSKPLLMNGKAITSRSPGGYFGVMVSLGKGGNTFTFSQGGETVKRTIYRGSSGKAKTDASTQLEITKGSCYPDVYDEYLMPGEKITLKCSAPIGSTVTVAIGGKSYKMNPASTKKPDSGYVATTFSCVYTVADPKKTGQVIDLGTPVYTMTYDKTTMSLAATGSVKCVTSGAPYYAVVNTDSAFTYTQSSTSGGPSGELALGQRDQITSVTSGGLWVRLASGQWILRENVTRELLDKPIVNTVASATYIPQNADRWEAIQFDAPTLPATKTSTDGKTIVLSLYNVTASPAVTLPASSSFSGVTSKMDGTRAVYTLTLKPGVKLGGYYVSTDNGQLRLNIRRIPVAVTGDKPLTGITVVVDPGHGGETGAIGPLGLDNCEKVVVLKSSLKLKAELEKLGATVVITRTADELVTLADRLTISRTVRPDLFISIHNNAVDVNVDASKIYGLGVWYRENISESFADSLSKYIIRDLKRVDRGTVQQNLYVCRGTWTSSVLIECGFICNPFEFEWLADDTSQSKLAASIARGVVNYMS